MREYQKGKINELAMNSKNNNIRDLDRGINESKKGKQLKSILVKDESCDLLADSHNILNTWKNTSILLNVNRVSDVRQTEIPTAELLIPDPRPFEVENVIAKLESYKLPGSDQILVELIQAESGTLWCEIHKFINSLWSKEELPDQGKESIIIPNDKKDYKTDSSNYQGISLLPTSYKILPNILLSKLNPYVDEITGDH
jgi:hypothetical protein